MTTTTLIPRPQWPPYQIKCGTVRELLNAMPTWTEAKFHLFKLHVASKAKTLGLDTYKWPQDQDDTKWNNLLHACRTEFPELDQFEGHWPVDIYYSKWVYFRVIEKRRREKKANVESSQSLNSKKRKAPQPSEEDKENPENPSLSAARSKRPTYQRASSPQNTSSCTSLSGPISRETNRSAGSSGSDDARVSLTRKDSNTSAGAKGSTRSSSSRRIENDHSFSANEMSSSPLASSSSSASRSPSCAQPAKKPNAHPQWGACVLCGYQPPVPAKETTKLHQCFRNRTDLLTRLAHAGVVADHHFRALLGFSQSRRKGFLSALTSAEKLTWVEKLEIDEALEIYLDKNPDLGSVERPREVRLTAIPRPNEGLENVLAVHTCKHSNVKRHMQIEDDGEYFDLVDLIERWSPLYLDTFSPFEGQDEETLDTLVNLLCEEKPSLRKYDDSWPVYLHVRRFLSARAAGLPCTPRQNSPTTAAPPQHKCPQLLIYPYSSVPPSITALLEDYGMKELGPAFLFLGFSSDAKFTNVVTSRNRKDHFLAELPLRVLECSEFQSLMLRYVLELA
ncbi:hypothetical protein K438DRAFT_1926028 [Mycena galopus ATCC 62051]|nr:hypothetical protein K438DRAFT_1926028 [Mycena galopus ATCC 62051]